MSKPTHKYQWASAVGYAPYEWTLTFSDTHGAGINRTADGKWELTIWDLPKTGNTYAGEYRLLRQAKVAGEQWLTKGTYPKDVVILESARDHRSYDDECDACEDYLGDDGWSFDNGKKLCSDCIGENEPMEVIGGFRGEDYRVSVFVQRGRGGVRVNWEKMWDEDEDADGYSYVTFGHPSDKAMLTMVEAMA